MATTGAATSNADVTSDPLVEPTPAGLTRGGEIGRAHV